MSCCRKICVLLDKTTISKFVSFALDLLKKSKNPCILSLKFGWVFRCVGDVDRIHKTKYGELSEKFVEMATEYFEGKSRRSRKEHSNTNVQYIDASL